MTPELVIWWVLECNGGQTTTSDDKTAHFWTYTTKTAKNKPTVEEKHAEKKDLLVM